MGVSKDPDPEFIAWAEQETIRRREEFLAEKAKPRFKLPEVDEASESEPEIRLDWAPDEVDADAVIVLDEPIGHPDSATTDLPACVDGIPLPFEIDLTDKEEGRRYTAVPNSVRVITLHDEYIDVLF